MQVLGDWLLTGQRAAVHVPTRTAVVADLHLGYGQARRRGGEAVPEFDMEEALAALGSLVASQDVRRLVVAGDLVESDRSAEAVTDFLDWLRGARVELVGFVLGNHDRRLMAGAASPPTCEGGVRLGRWRVCHGDAPLPAAPVVHGHFHPCLRWANLKAPCYLVSAKRLVLPAFSADAAGVNVLRDRRWAGYRCYAVAGGEVLDFGEVGMLRRRVAGGRRKA
jgi:putative SbcD/Mre11-related phosphoesterase